MEITVSKETFDNIQCGLEKLVFKIEDDKPDINLQRNANTIIICDCVYQLSRRQFNMIDILVSSNCAIQANDLYERYHGCKCLSKNGPVYALGSTISHFNQCLRDKHIPLKICVKNSTYFLRKYRNETRTAV